MSRDDALERLVAAVDELTMPRVTIENIPGWTAARNKTLRVHRAVHDALLVELALAIHCTGASEGDRGHGVPGPRDPARLGAIDRLRAIESGVTEWLVRLQIMPRGSVAENLRALVGVAGEMSDDMLGWLSLEAHRWVIWARVVTGWQSPPFMPRAPCPACERIGGLRINLDRKAGCCMVCGADWYEQPKYGADGELIAGSIYVLADYVREWTNDEPEGETA